MKEPRALKRFGQNFLQDEVVLSAIVAIHSRITESDVIEIGPGLGALSRYILSKNPKCLYAFEIDSRCAVYLKNNLNFSNFKLIEEDALTVDWPSFLQTNNLKRAAIIANLPYNVGCLLLVNWLKQGYLFDRMILMFQKEVADRICAQPNSKSYGRLTLLSQFTCQVEKIFDVPPHAFVPAPKITSSVVHFIPKQLSSSEQKLIEPLEKVSHITFSKRRKMIRSSLKSLLNADQMSQLATLIDLSQRPEQIGLDEFINMTQFCVDQGVV